MKDAVRASILITGIFVPVVPKNKCLVDGGLIDLVPVEVPKDMGADFIAAVNVLVELRKSKSTTGSTNMNDEIGIPNILNTLLQSLHIIEYEIAKYKILHANLVISPRVNHIEAFYFHQSEEAVLTGYKAGKEILPK